MKYTKIKEFLKKRSTKVKEFFKESKNNGISKKKCLFAVSITVLGICSVTLATPALKSILGRFKVPKRIPIEPFQLPEVPLKIGSKELEEVLYKK